MCAMIALLISENKVPVYRLSFGPLVVVIIAVLETSRQSQGSPYLIRLHLLFPQSWVLPKKDKKADLPLVYFLWLHFLPFWKWPELTGETPNHRDRSIRRFFCSAPLKVPPKTTPFLVPMNPPRWLFTFSTQIGFNHSTSFSPMNWWQKWHPLSTFFPFFLSIPDLKSKS